MTIVKKNRDPISLSNPQLQKEMTELIGALVYFLVGKGTILKD
jgi:hypothetical protein